MVSTARAVKTVLGMVGIMGLGLALWKVIVPDEEEMWKRAKELPRTTPQQLAKQQELNALVMAALKEAAETNENVARRPYPWKK